MSIVGAHAKSAAVIIVFAASLSVGGSTAHACSCDPTPLSEFVDLIDLAFVGTQTERVVRDEVDDNGVELTFAVSEVYAGEVSDPMVVYTHAQGDACGVDYSDAGQVAVVAFEFRSLPAVGLCTMSTAEELTALFGEPTSPATTAPPTTPPSTTPPSTAAPITIAASAAPTGPVTTTDGTDALAGGTSRWIWPSLVGAAIVAFAGATLLLLRRRA